MITLSIIRLVVLAMLIAAAFFILLGGSFIVDLGFAGAVVFVVSWVVKIKKKKKGGRKIMLKDLWDDICEQTMHVLMIGASVIFAVDAVDRYRIWRKAKGF